MLIGLGYKARTGKDTVAAHLVDTGHFQHTSFAARLKAAAGVIFGLTSEQLYGTQKESIDPFWQDTPRNILQKMGTECMRNGYRQDIWVKAAFRYMEQYDAYAHCKCRWVISDVRFKNEAEAIKDAGGVLIRIDRPSIGDGIIATKTHASEVALENYNGWDQIFINDGTKHELFQKVDNYVLSNM